MAFEDPAPEPEYNLIDKTEKSRNLNFSGVSDYAKFESDVKEIIFKPTLMYTSRNHNFSLKNISTINMKYSCKIIKATDDGVEEIDPGFFHISPKIGDLAPNCDETFSVTFSPIEVEEKNERFLVIMVENLQPE